MIYYTPKELFQFEHQNLKNQIDEGQSFPLKLEEFFQPNL
jgi:hypothetical protein